MVPTSMVCLRLTTWSGIKLSRFYIVHLSLRKSGTFDASMRLTMRRRIRTGFGRIGRHMRPHPPD